MAAGPCGELPSSGARGLVSSANLTPGLRSRSYPFGPFSTSRSFSCPLSLRRSLSLSRSRYLADGRAVVTADLDVVGLTRCGNPRERDGCGVGGVLGELSLRYRVGEPLSGDKSVSTKSCGLLCAVVAYAYHV